MSAENVELVHEMYAAWDRGDIQAIVDMCDPKVVIVQPPQVPDSKSYRGHQGIAEAFEDWPKQWDEFQARLEEVIDVDQRHAISMNRQLLKVRDMSLENEVYFLHRFERGKQMRVDMFLSRQEALDAANADR